MYCRKCGEMLNEDSIFCHKCGSRVIININTDINVNAKVTKVHSESVNNTADIDVSNENVQYATINNYTTENHFERRSPSIDAGKIVESAVKKTSSAWKTSAVIVLIIALIIAGSSAYLEYFVSGPEATIDKMMDAVSDMDINTAITCFCPKVVSEYKGMMGLADTIMGFAGIGGSMENLAGLAPLLMGSEYEMPELSCKVVSIKYSGGTYEIFPIKINGIAKILASDATVTVDEYENGEYFATESIRLKRYGSDGWLIEDDLFK